MRYRNLITGQVVSTTGVVHGGDWVPAEDEPAGELPRPPAVAAPSAEPVKPPASKKNGKKAAGK